jgi:hypothetical protein
MYNKAIEMIHFKPKYRYWNFRSGVVEKEL